MGKVTPPKISIPIGNTQVMVPFVNTNHDLGLIKNAKLDKYIDMTNEKIKLYKDNALFCLSSISNSKYKDTLLKIED